MKYHSFNYKLIIYLLFIFFFYRIKKKIIIIIVLVFKIFKVQNFDWFKLNKLKYIYIFFL